MLLYFGREFGTGRVFPKYSKCSWLSNSLLQSAVVFLLALSASITFTFSKVLPRLFFDSCHYLMVSRLTADWIVPYHTSSQDNWIKLVQGMLLDGPVVPALGSISLVVSRWLSFENDITAVLILQAVLHSASALTIFWLVVFWSNSKRQAFFASVLWGLYPAAIVATSQFLTETTAALANICFILCSALALSRSRAGSGSDVEFHISAIALWFLSGLIFAIGALNKTAWLPGLTAIAALALLQLRVGRIVWSALLSLAAGVAAAMLPWLVFTTVSLGSPVFSPERVPSLNLAIGLDTEADAWETIPMPCFTLNNCFEKAQFIFASALQNKPAETVNLFLRKIIRIWAVPWNTFRLPVFGLGFEAQEIIHRAICLAGLIGIFVSCAMLPTSIRGVGESSRHKVYITMASLVAIFSSLVFIPFEGTSRYAFASMPFVVVFASSGIASVIGEFFCLGALKSFKDGLCVAAIIFSAAVGLSLWQIDLVPYFVLLTGDASSSRLYALVLICFFLVLFFSALLALAQARSLFYAQKRSNVLLFCLAVLSAVSSIFALNGNQVPLTEWKTELPIGHEVQRTAAAVRGKPDWAMVVADITKPDEFLTFRVNGVQLAGKLRSIYEIPSQYEYHRTLLHIMSEAAAGSRLTMESLRQWRFIPVPLELLQYNANNLISVCSSGGGISLFGNYVRSKDRRLLMPLLYGFSMSKYSYSGDGRLTDFSTCLAHNSFTEQRTGKPSEIEKQDLSSEPGAQTGTYRLFIIAGYSNDNAKSAHQQPSFIRHHLVWH